MVSDQLNTGGAYGQPVRFYKFVALTFLVITIVLLGGIIFMSSKRAEITIVTKADPVEVNTVIDINPNDDSSIVSGFVTSTFVELSKAYSPKGNKTEDAIATGELIIINDSSAAQPLISTTRFMTPEGLLFRLKSGVTVPAGGQVTAEVYADKAGESGNIGPSNFTIPGLNEAKQKLIYAKSEAIMTGGVKTIGVFSQEDLTNAQNSLLADLKTKGIEMLGTQNSDKKGLFDVVQYTLKMMENRVLK